MGLVLIITFVVLAVLLLALSSFIIGSYNKLVTLRNRFKNAYAQIAACIPYATVTHIRESFDDQSPIDMDRVWRLFARAGHKGHMSLEYEPGPHGEPAITGVPKMIAKIRELCTKYSSI